MYQKTSVFFIIYGKCGSNNNIKCSKKEFFDMLKILGVIDNKNE